MGIDLMSAAVLVFDRLRFNYLEHEWIWIINLDKSNVFSETSFILFLADNFIADIELLSKLFSIF